jgi:hypothetical protein
MPHGSASFLSGVSGGSLGTETVSCSGFPGFQLWVLSHSGVYGWRVALEIVVDIVCD